MYKQVLDPVSHSLGLTSIFAILPLLVLFVLLGVVRLQAQWAALITLAVAIIVALAVYGMPFGQAADSALEGAAFGFWPIMWIVINALWIFNMTEATGHFAVLKRAFATVSDDHRVQVIVIAFCFGALLEALGGFGTPVAICGVMLVGLGLSPIRAAVGSDTSSNSLFGALQVAAAKQSGLSPTLLAAANSSGGVIGKMISPQNLAIGAAAVGVAGREGDIFRKVIGWSLAMLLIVAVLVLLQSISVLSWMVP